MELRFAKEDERLPQIVHFFQQTAIQAIHYIRGVRAGRRSQFGKFGWVLRHSYAYSKNSLNFVFDEQTSKFAADI